MPRLALQTPYTLTKDLATGNAKWPAALGERVRWRSAAQGIPRPEPGGDGPGGTGPGCDNNTERTKENADGDHFLCEASTGNRRGNHIVVIESARTDSVFKDFKLAKSLST
jgi:hypothetical protein